MSLSDKRLLNAIADNSIIYYEEDVVEFIKRFLSYCEDTNIFIDPLHIAKFKELAGEDLI